MAQKTVWDGCYAQGWKGLIVPEAFQHPAKVARGLIHRLYTHLATHYDLRPGTTILDPFAGTGLHGLDCLLAGFHFRGIEIEPRFVTLAQHNIEYWRHKFGPQPGTAQVMQGDSRHLQDVVRAAGCVVSSPPYAHGCTHTGGADKHPEHIQGGTQSIGLGYRSVVSSPPYESSVSAHSHGIDWSKTGAATGNRRRGPGTQHEVTLTAQLAYGTTPGQLGAMPPGDAPTIVSSQPYVASQVGYCEGNVGGALGGAIASRHRKPQENVKAVGYGQAPGQLGAESPETFWSASAQIMAELAALLPTGALAVWIVKPYVRHKTIVDFPGDWQRLCEAHGFMLVERITASLVEHHGTETTLWGEAVTRQTKRASFFRSLHEQKYPDMAIDAEVVLILSKG